MEEFVVLTTTTDQHEANKTCSTLETAGIPVLTEHVEITEGSLRATGFRLLVPLQHAQAARKITRHASARRNGPVLNQLLARYSSLN